MSTATQSILERRSTCVIRRVSINRNLSPEQMQEMIDASGWKDWKSWKQAVNREILAGMPSQGTGIEDDVDMHFLFIPGPCASLAAQEAALSECGLEPDYYGQLQVNIDDPLFANARQNVVKWREKNGEVSLLAFGFGLVIVEEPNVVCGSAQTLILGSGWWIAGRVPRS